MSLFLLSPFFCLTQKTYSFDFAVVFETHLTQTKKTYKNSYFINSKLPNYYAFIKDLDKDTLSLSFIDNNGTKVYDAKFKSTSFANAENISFDCKLVKEHHFYFAYKSKDYMMQKLTDTIIRDTSYQHVVFKSKKNIGYQKRKKIVSRFFIIDKRAQNTPIFIFPNELLFDIYMKSSQLFEGRIRSAYDKNSEGKIEATYNYIYTKIHRNIIIPEDCDFTLQKNKIKNKVRKFEQ